MTVVGHQISRNYGYLEKGLFLLPIPCSKRGLILFHPPLERAPLRVLGTCDLMVRVIALHYVLRSAVLHSTMKPFCPLVCSELQPANLAQGFGKAKNRVGMARPKKQKVEVV